MKIMITGFNPFNGEKVNPAQEVLKFLPDTIKGHRLVKLNVETSFEKAASQVYDALLAEMPDYCINIGQAGGRSGITPEKIAINWVDASIADNTNYQPKGQKIVAKGMDGYFTHYLLMQLSKIFEILVFLLKCQILLVHMFAIIYFIKFNTGVIQNFLILKVVLYILLIYPLKFYKVINLLCH